MLSFAALFLVGAIASALVGLGASAGSATHLAQMSCTSLGGLFGICLAADAWISRRLDRERQARENVQKFVRERQRTWLQARKLAA